MKLCAQKNGSEHLTKCQIKIYLLSCVVIYGRNHPRGTETEINVNKKYLHFSKSTNFATSDPPKRIHDFYFVVNKKRSGPPYSLFKRSLFWRSPFSRSPFSRSLFLTFAISYFEFLVIRKISFRSIHIRYFGPSLKNVLGTLNFENITFLL